jgi:PKD repeat protein
MAVLEQSPANINILYAGRSDKKVFRTDDAFSSNPTWYDITAELPQNVTAGDIEAHPFDENIVYILLGSNIYKSNDKGYSWENISGSLPDVNLTSIAYYKNSVEGLYVSSDLGVFYRDASMSDWIWFNTGLPVDASVREIEIYYHPDSISEDAIRAGTYGRGLWGSDMYYGAPTAAFTSSATLVPPDCGVDFYDASSGVPHFFQWTFDGATPPSSIERDPLGISYDTPGTYAVKLKVRNELGEDSVYVVDYITVSADILPEVEFVADNTTPCGTDVVRFTDLSLNCPSTFTWQFNPDQVTYLEGTDEHSQNPVVRFDETGTYSVTLIAGNANGSGNLSKIDYVVIGGMTLPYTEDFEGGSFTDASWTVENPDQDITWAMTEVEGNSPGNQAAWINIFDYYAFGPRDYLVSPPLDFSGFSTLGLMFQHAYAKRFGLADTLIVSISDDCGSSWTRLYSAYLDELATSPEDEESFFPESADDWCGEGYGVGCNILDLTPWAGQSDIKIRFETFGRYGNNIFIDNIQISNAVGIADVKHEEKDINIYPNPSEGVFNISLPGNQQRMQMSVTDVSGQIMYSQNIGENETLSSFDASSLAKGIYFIRFVSDEMNEIRKIVVR